MGDTCGQLTDHFKFLGLGQIPFEKYFFRNIFI